MGPLQGFGKMWQKTYRVRLKGADVTPHEVIQTWKTHYKEFWPEGNVFYAPLAGISPGEVALISGSLPGGVKLSTGVMVLYSDDESFSLMTPQGHPFSGWITFSAHEAEGTPVAQVQVLMRANDPLYELGLRMGGHKMEDQMWQQTLTNLARHFGMNQPVETNVVCVDPEAAVERVQERLAQRRHPLRPVPGDRPAALAPRPVAKVNESAASMHPVAVESG